MHSQSLRSLKGFVPQNVSLSLLLFENSCGLIQKVSKQFVEKVCQSNIVSEYDTVNVML